MWPGVYSPAAVPSSCRAAPAKNRSALTHSGISSSSTTDRILPVSRTSRSANSSACASRASAIFSRASCRCAGVLRRHTSNACAAAASALSTSDCVAIGAGAEHFAGRRVGQVEGAGHAFSRWVGSNIFSRAGRTTTDGPGVRSASARSAPTVSKVDSVAEIAERLMPKRHEVRPGQLGGRRLAERAGEVLAEDAVTAVVDDQPGDVRLVLHRGGQLGDAVHRATVAGHGQRRPAGRGRAAERAGQAVTEAARALGGVDRRAFGVPRRPGPVRGDRHVPERLGALGDGRADVVDELAFDGQVLTVQTRLHARQQRRDRGFGPAVGARASAPTPAAPAG